ncbi:MAG TPA: hypothetical protein VF595_14655 [Tepidisphaeraceae bacterium]
MSQLRLSHPRINPLPGQHHVQRRPLGVQVGEAEFPVAVFNAGAGQVGLQHLHRRHAGQNPPRHSRPMGAVRQQFLDRLRVQRQYVRPLGLGDFGAELNVRRRRVEHQIAPFQLPQFRASQTGPDRQQIRHPPIDARLPRPGQNLRPHLRPELALLLARTEGQHLGLRPAQRRIEQLHDLVDRQRPPRVHLVRILLIGLRQANQWVVLDLPPVLGPLGEALHAVEVFVAGRHREQSARFLKAADRPHLQHDRLISAGVDVDPPPRFDRGQHAADATLQLRYVRRVAAVRHHVRDVFPQLILHRLERFVPDVAVKPFPLRGAFLLQPLRHRERLAAVGVRGRLLPDAPLGVEPAGDPLHALLPFVSVALKY